MLQRIPRRRPFRALAERALLGDPAPGDVEALLAVLRQPRTRRWRERAVATWLLGSVPMSYPQRTEAAALLADVLTLAGPERRACRASLVRSTATWAATAITIITAAYLTAMRTVASNCPHWDCRALVLSLGFWPGHGLIALIGLTLAWPIIALAATEGRADWRRAAAARSLGALALPESVDALALGWSRAGYATRPACLDALFRVLPNLRSEQYGTLAQSTVPALCSLLLYYRWPPTWRKHELILDALASVGDSRACDPLERYLRDPLPAEVRARAQRALEVVRERRERERAPQRLLRAATEPRGDALLRPSGSMAHTDAELLLKHASPAEPAP